MLTLCVGIKPDRHEEIAIEGIDCPACQALEELRETKEKLLEANKTIQAQDEMIAGLRSYPPRFPIPNPAYRPKEL